MGLLDNIRGLFSGSKDNQPVRPQIDEESEKARLADSIENLVRKINSKSFDVSVIKLANLRSYDFRTRNSLPELKKLHDSLEMKYEQLTKQSQQRNPSSEALEASKWTGQRPKGMSEHDFDRFQQSDDGAR